MLSVVIRVLFALLLGVTALGGAPTPTASAADGDEWVISGVVYDATGAPREGVVVHLQNEDITPECYRVGCAGVPERWTVVTDAYGRYEASTYGFRTSLWISEPGFVSDYRRDVVDGIYSFRLRAGPTGFAPVTVSGRVTDADGAPVVGAGVVRPPISRWWSPLAVTDSNGWYRFQFDPLLWTVEAPESIGFVPDPEADPASAVHLVRRVGGDGRWPYFAPGEHYVENFTVPSELLPARLPAAPRRVDGRALGPHRAVLRFAAGGAADATRFEARCFHRGVRKRTVWDVDPPIRLARLHAGRTFRCKVRARNEAGWGAFSPLSAPFRTPVRR